MIILLIFLVIYIAGAGATFYSLVRWTSLRPDEYDSADLYMITAGWPIAMPLLLVIAAVLAIGSKLSKLGKEIAKIAEADAKKDKEKTSK
jgi:hypothetical protein